jgi:hypothetical protein
VVPPVAVRVIEDTKQVKVDPFEELIETTGAVVFSVITTVLVALHPLAAVAVRV